MQLLVACSPPGNSITVTSEGGKCTLDGESRISAGEVTVKWNIKDKTRLIYALSFLTLDKDHGYKDLVDYVNVDFLEDFPPTWSQFQGDIFPAKPDSLNEKIFNFDKGPLYLVCLSGDSSVNTKETPVKVNGVLGPIKVVN
jgi:hypothetical protein